MLFRATVSVGCISRETKEGARRGKIAGLLDVVAGAVCLKVLSRICNGSIQVIFVVEDGCSALSRHVCSYDIDGLLPLPRRHDDDDDDDDNNNNNNNNSILNSIQFSFISVLA
jgi:hypothetical protein